MSSTNPDPVPGKFDEEQERLVHALISRSLITRDEVQACKAPESKGAKSLLTRLVEEHVLTPGQARRAWPSSLCS